MSLAALLLVSQNGVINVKAADIESESQQSMNSSHDKIDELAEYLANEFKTEYPQYYETIILFAGAIKITLGFGDTLLHPFSQNPPTEPIIVALLSFLLAYVCLRKNKQN